MSRRKHNDVSITAGLEDKQFDVGLNDIDIRIDKSGIEYRYFKEKEFINKAESVVYGTENGSIGKNDSTTNVLLIPKTMISQSKLGNSIVENGKKSHICSVIWTSVMILSTVLSISLSLLQKRLFILFVFLLVALIGVRLARPKWFSSNVNYSLCLEAQVNWESFVNSLLLLYSCSEKWITEKENQHPGSKYNSWTTNSISTDRIVSVRKLIPNQSNEFKIDCNVTAVEIKSYKNTLLFLPSDIVVKSYSTLLSYSYAQISTLAEQFIFVNSHSPKDTEVVGTTWQYVNKDGSQDLRFKNNPVRYRCRYGKVVFSSKDGINIEIDMSNKTVAERISNAYSEYRNSVFGIK